MSIRIVLIGTTHPGNIGAVARAMKNMGFDELVLVEPRYFPHAEATARASGAVDVLERAVVLPTLADAVADCVFVVGASARSRAIDWPCHEPRDGARRLIDMQQQGPVAAVFGPEKYGLTNAHLDLCNALLTIPVQVLAYELRLALSTGPGPVYASDARPATSAELEHFYAHLEQVLTEVRFLDPDNPRHLMRRLRRLFLRAAPDHNEINILRGILTAVERYGKPVR